MKKIYYHISRHIDKVIDVFEPKVPFSVCPNEDNKIKRVCICENIYQCFNGIHYVHDKDCYDAIGERYKPVRLYTFELDEKDVVKSEEVFKYVPDALATKECWSLKSIKPIDSYVIEPTYIGTEDKYPFLIIHDCFDFDKTSNVTKLREEGEY